VRYILVLVVALVAGDVDVVDPYLVRFLDSDSVPGTGEDLGDLDVADNHVRLLVHAEADTIESCATIG